MATETEREIITSLLFSDFCPRGKGEADLLPLAARDVGSRARNLDDPSSDYDVMVVYLQPWCDYVTPGGELDTTEETIKPDHSDNELDTEIEFQGWNLKKFVGNDGIRGSNPTAMEFVMSGEQYFVDQEIREHIEHIDQHAMGNFKPYALINHYRSLAASNFGKYIEGDYKLTEGTSYDDLMFPANPTWDSIAHNSTDGMAVDEEKTKIGEDEISVYGEFTKTPFLGTIDIDKAKEKDLVEPTTTDVTTKRYLNICRALINARLIEETHELPPNDLNESLRHLAGADFMPEEVYAGIGRLISKKVGGDGEQPPVEKVQDRINGWVRSELDRDVNPEGHVDQHPDRDKLAHETMMIVDTFEAQ